MNKRVDIWTIALLAIIISGLALSQYVVEAAPAGATITSNVTETPGVAAADSLTTAGGSFTTLLLNASQQNPRWKAYVGNISGDLSLDDASGQTIYDWDITVITGEVFASRNDSINWSNIGCAQPSTIQAEDAFNNMSSSQEDSINVTFANTVHQQFFVGNTEISNSTCPAIATYVNSTEQAASEDADFQEILLEDSNSLVYTTILEQDQEGYDSGLFDFQMIVAESDVKETPTTYYFYAEIG